MTVEARYEEELKMNGGGPVPLKRVALPSGRPGWKEKLRAACLLRMRHERQVILERNRSSNKRLTQRSPGDGLELEDQGDVDDVAELSLDTPLEAIVREEMAEFFPTYSLTIPCALDKTQLKPFSASKPYSASEPYLSFGPRLPIEGPLAHPLGSCASTSTTTSGDYSWKTIAEEGARAVGREEADIWWEPKRANSHRSSDPRMMGEGDRGKATYPLANTTGVREAHEDMLWEYEPRDASDEVWGVLGDPDDEDCTLTREEYLQLLEEMERVLRQDAEEDFYREALAAALREDAAQCKFEERQLQYQQDLEEGDNSALPCPICHTRPVCQSRLLLFCTCGEFRLDMQSEQMGLEFLRDRLREVCEDHVDSGCPAKPAFQMEEQSGVPFLSMRCSPCETFVWVA
eukprot:TRINITY_DN17120_c0_g1_i1.p1 TRINITY_DN17120_c0_g1~~TRINITY_DN17120_c0_g1_i1.p1  ORF type:complete len:403 (+),score=65.76 TRINITY_DN17120_c0_g1_i1:181-1389(+)